MICSMAHRTSPSGFSYWPDAVSRDEETAWVHQTRSLAVQAFRIPRPPRQSARRLLRLALRLRCPHLQPATPIPSFLLPLRERAAGFAGVASESLEHILVTEYSPGAGYRLASRQGRIRRCHCDLAARALHIAVSSENGAGWERASQRIVPRSAYLLRGTARGEWEHSIPQLDRLRYSLTFRNLVAVPDPSARSRPARGRWSSPSRARRGRRRPRPDAARPPGSAADGRCAGRRCAA